MELRQLTMNNPYSLTPDPALASLAIRKHLSKEFTSRLHLNLDKEHSTVPHRER